MFRELVCLFRIRMRTLCVFVCVFLFCSLYCSLNSNPICAKKTIRTASYEKESKREPITLMNQHANLKRENNDTEILYNSN